MQLNKSLRNIGLSDKEVAIYLAVLQTGEVSLTSLAKKSGIRRTTVYHSLGELLGRGFVSRKVKGKRILYVPEDPKRIASDFERRKDSFLAIAPQIDALYKNARHKPDVRIYENRDGIRQILREVSSALTPIDAFFSPEKFFRSVSQEDTREFLDSIRRNENVLRDLVEHDARAEAFVGDVRKEQGRFHKAKLLPKDFTVSVDVLVTGSKVAMISFDHMMGAIIENPEIAEFHRSVHSFLWKSLV